MHGLSTKPEYMIPCLTVYNGVNVKLKDSINGIGCARFFSPKPGLEEKCEPFIEIFNSDTRKSYQICAEQDHGATQCVMKLLREKFIVPEEEESLFYIIFVLLHEAGHWNDYINRRIWYNQNFIDNKDETEEEYRNRPCENSADIFALEHFEEAWNELNDHLFHGIMEPLKKQVDK